MIIKASQRAGARQLAQHLMNDRDNEHITLHEVRGFVSHDLHGAFDEAHAIAKGTRCEQYLFSVSFNPPQEVEAKIEDFEKAINEAEHRLGLTDQPRAIVFHEKEGRRHAHVVWSRIDGEQMKAVNMPFYKRKLNGLAKELYLEHGWSLPDGFKDPLLTNPLNFTREQWEQAKRTHRDPREIKHAIYESYAHSDNKQSFEAAMDERGFKLARGDRRGFVAVDYEGEVYSLSRWIRIKSKDLKARLGNPKELRSVQDTKDLIRRQLTPKYKQYIQELKDSQQQDKEPLTLEKERLLWSHKQQRKYLKEHQAARRKMEDAVRQSRFNRGMKGLWDKLSGEARLIKERNAFEAWANAKRDQKQYDRLILKQIGERKNLQSQFIELKEQHKTQRRKLYKKLSHSLRLDGKSRQSVEYPQINSPPDNKPRNLYVRPKRPRIRDELNRER